MVSEGKDPTSLPKSMKLDFHGPKCRNDTARAQHMFRYKARRKFWYTTHIFRVFVTVQQPSLIRVKANLYAMAAAQEELHVFEIDQLLIRPGLSCSSIRPSSLPFCT